MVIHKLEVLQVIEKSHDSRLEANSCDCYLALERIVIYLKVIQILINVRIRRRTKGKRTILAVVNI